MTDAQERRLGWSLVALAIVLFTGPLAGSSVVNAGVAAWRALIG